MKRLNRYGVCLFVCLAVLAVSPVFAATITVTSTNDSGSGSLRDAIAGAAPGDTINFNLTYPARITIASTLSIGTNLTISGPGASNLAINGNDSVRVFYINAGVTAAIAGVTIEHGSGSWGGGGVYNNGTLTVGNSTLAGNSSSVANGGGAIYNYYGDLTVTNSTLAGNSATAVYGDSASGGGIFNYNGTLAVSNSTLSGNSAAAPAGAFGGGISNLGGMLIVTNSTFTANSAPYGGALENLGGTLTIITSTISGNSALYGGGVYDSGYGTLVTKNTIVANTSSGGNCSSAGGYSISNGHNLSDDATCFFSEPGDMNSTPAGLDPSGLQDHGGPTQTIALWVTSPAVDAIPISPTNYCTLPDGVTPVATDQRGVVRPQVSRCDIGAYELKPFAFSSFSTNLELGSGKQGGFSLNAAFTLGAGSAPIDPLTQAVRLQIGPYMVTIPAGSFHQAQGSNLGSWAYAGSISGVKLSVQIAALGDDSYQFKATGSPVNFSGVSNPVSVTIGIGFDAGSTQVSARL